MKSFINNIILALCILLFACKEDIIEKLDFPEYSLSEYIYELMVTEKWYYWIDSITPVKPERDEDPEIYMKKLLYDKYDEWSFIEDIQSYDSYFISGSYIGYGFMVIKHTDNTLRFAFVFKDSPFGDNNVKRGYKLISVDDDLAINLYNQNIFNTIIGQKNSHIFSVEDFDGKEYTFSANKEEIIQETVLAHQIFNINNKKVGYFIFNTFIQTAFEELEELFNEFNTEQVDELIVDLRYNGGGQLDVAVYLANLIAGLKANGEIFNTTQYNNYKSDLNESEYFSVEDNSLSLDRVFFITTPESASASELVINAVIPFMEVVLIGEPSNGKPVGMRPFRYKNMVVAPITFKSVNADNEGDYYNGFPVDALTHDGLDKDFCDPEEACLKQALNYIEYGTFITNETKKSAALIEKRSPLKGFSKIVGAY